MVTCSHRVRTIHVHVTGWLMFALYNEALFELIHGIEKTQLLCVFAF